MTARPRRSPLRAPTTQRPPGSAPAGVPAARRWQPVAAAGALLLVLLAAGVALGLSGSALVRQPTDFSIYYAAARVLLAGGNPYDWHALRHIVASVPAPGYVYPLWALLAILPVVWLPLPVAAGIWLMGNLTCLALSLALLAREAGLATRSYWLPGLFLASCLSIPGLFALLQGQIVLPLLAAVVAAYLLARQGRAGWVGVLLALSLTKPQLTWLPVLVVLAVAWWRGVGWAALRWLGGTLAALVAASFALRPDWLVGWVASLRQDAAVGGTGARTLQANMGTIPALAAHLPWPLALLLVGVSLLAGLLLLGWQGSRALGPQGKAASPEADRGAAQLVLLAVAIGVGTALSPWMWIYDGVFWLVIVLASVARGPAWRRAAAVAVFVAVPWSVRLIAVAAQGGAGTSLNKLQDVVLAPLLLVTLLAFSPDASWRSLTAWIRALGGVRQSAIRWARRR